jgi:hypothetical protein
MRIYRKAPFSPQNQKDEKKIGRNWRGRHPEGYKAIHNIRFFL